MDARSGPTLSLPAGSIDGSISGGSIGPTHEIRPQPDASLRLSFPSTASGDFCLSLKVADFQFIPLRRSNSSLRCCGAVPDPKALYASYIGRSASGRHAPSAFLSTAFRYVLAAKLLVDLWNCTVASWSQSVTSSTPFMGFIPANPFAVLIRLGSGFEVFLQTLARMLFGESSSRFISVGRQVDAIENTRSVNYRPVMMIHPSFRVRQLLNQLNLPARVAWEDRSCLGLFFFQVYRPPDLLPSTAEDKHPLMGFLTVWVLKLPSRLASRLQLHCRQSFSVFKNPTPGSFLMPWHQ